jgi:hypothetical protein
MGREVLIHQIKERDVAVLFLFILENENLRRIRAGSYCP